MATDWEHEVFVIGVSAAMPGAIAALDLAFPRDDGQPRDPTKPAEVGQQMSATGLEPVTHYGAAFSVTETIRQTLEGMGLAQTPGITYWRATNPGGILIATNNSPDLTYIGQAWTWAQCLQSLALQPVQRPIN